MPKPTELTQLPPKILLYGRPGSGKTALTATLGDKLQLLDLDRGWLTALTLKDSFTEQRKNIDIIECYHDKPTLPNAIQKVKAALNTIQHELFVKKSWPFKVLALDSLTSLSDVAMNWILHNQNHVGKAPTLQEWGFAILEVKTILETIRHLPIPCILIAHDEIVEVGSDASKYTEIRINALGRKLPNEVGMYFDEIWYLRAQAGPGGTTKYVIQSRQSQSILARSRANLPDNTDQNLGMEKLLETLGYKI